MLAEIHGWCGRLHDPDRGQPCPCRTVPDPCPCSDCQSIPLARRPSQRALSAANRATLDEWVAAIVGRAA